MTIVLEALMNSTTSSIILCNTREHREQ